MVSQSNQYEGATLGAAQQDVLNSLRRHGSWHFKCGWVWNTRHGTMLILNALVRKGLVTRSIDGVYKEA